MRSLTEIQKNRFEAQVKEAKLVGLEKTAEVLKSKLDKVSVRKNGASYTYSNEDFKKDVNNILWDVVVRFADFHDVSVDLKEAQEILSKTAEELINDLRIKTNIEHGVGAFEPNLPGESRKTVLLDVEE